MRPLVSQKRQYTMRKLRPMPALTTPNGDQGYRPKEPLREPVTLPTEDPTPLSDGELLHRIATRRDKAAFDTLFQRYAGKIKGAIIKRGVGGDEADEAAQEAMLAVWRRAATYDPAKAPAAAWIFTIARNRRIDMLRRASRPAPDPEDPLFQPDPQPTPESETVLADRNRALRMAVAGLSEAQRAVVHLAFFEGMSHGQIAEELGAPLGTVKSRLRLAVERLRTALGPDFQEELFDE